jgi:hypothetical protein
MIFNARKDYYEVYNWVSAVVDANAGTNAVIKHKLDVFVRSRGGGADIYSFASSYVANPRIGTPSINSREGIFLGTERIPLGHGSLKRKQSSRG